MNSWPRAKVIMRNGEEKFGEVAHTGEKYTTVRFEGKEYEELTPFGPRKFNFSYRDMPNQYVEIL